MIDPKTFRDIVTGSRSDLAAKIFRAVLRLAEIPYTIVVQARNRRFDRDTSRVQKVSVPVISVGNLTLGGTGKTPFVGWLAQWFLDRNTRPVIVSRGYGSQDGRPNDEALELASRLPSVPHLQNPDRVAAATQAISDHQAQIILLDDGFQHRKIDRDLNLLLVDATDPFGCEHVFPRGTLREPLHNASRADAIVLTRCGQVSDERLGAIEQRFRTLGQSAIVSRIRHHPRDWITSDGTTKPIEALADKSVVAFSAIGNPQAFLKTLEDCHVRVQEFIEFPDHHIFHQADVERIRNAINGRPADFIVCTHKDLVKLTSLRLLDAPILALRIGMEFLQGQSEMEKKLHSILDRVSVAV